MWCHLCSDSLGIRALVVRTPTPQSVTSWWFSRPQRTRGRLFAVERGAEDDERIGLTGWIGVTPGQIRRVGVVSGV